MGLFNMLKFIKLTINSTDSLLFIFLDLIAFFFLIVINCFYDVPVPKYQVVILVI